MPLSDRDQFNDWCYFYEQYFDDTIALPEISKVQFPAPVDGFEDLVIMPKGLTLELAQRVFAKLFSLPSFADIASLEMRHKRNPSNGTYAIRVENLQQETQLKSRNRTVISLYARNLVGLTVLEYLMLYAKFYDETGLFLDTNGATFCLGSQSSGNRPLAAFWSEDGLVLAICKLNMPDAITGYREVMLA